MNKKLLLLFSFCIAIASCEKDDFCTQNPVTPNLILRFYDDVNRTEIKRTNGLYVWAENKDSIVINQELDSLVIPLNTASNETIYNISDGIRVNQFTITYDVTNQYVSRSCGFRAVFENVTFTSNNAWFTDFTPSTLTIIDNQNAAHVQVFH